MKTTNKSNTWLLSVALAVATASVMPVNSSAQEKGSTKGGAQQLTQSKPIRTLEDLSAIQPGDMMVMSCPKCKDVTTRYVLPTFKGFERKDKMKTVHTCPGCNNTTTVEGHGKAKKDVIKHVCQKCGSKDAFCCVLKKSSDPTKGMEERN